MDIERLADQQTARCFDCFQDASVQPWEGHWLDGTETGQSGVGSR
jgi:hypothetical protein